MGLLVCISNFPNFVVDFEELGADLRVVTGAGKGVDIVDPSDGALIVRIQTSYKVQNFACTGKDYKEFWLMGNGVVSRVKWNLQGQELK